MKKLIAALIAAVMVASMGSIAFAADIVLYRELYNGVVGEDVASVQGALSDLGYGVGGVDGVFGSVTEAAVMAFQRDYGLYVDGLVGNVTAGVINSLTGGAPASSGSDSSSVAGGYGAISTSRSLSWGNSGSDVAALQSALAALGYNVGGIDGDFGSMTDAAVKAFQRDNGLYVDGVAGPATIGVLNGMGGSSSAPSNDVPASSPSGTTLFGLIETSRTLYRGTSGSDVAALQSALAALGYSVGSIDGDFGGYTDAAVKAFQSDNGLYVDGEAGPVTINAINAKAVVAAHPAPEPAPEPTPEPAPAPEPETPAVPEAPAEPAPPAVEAPTEPEMPAEPETPAEPAPPTGNEPAADPADIMPIESFLEGVPDTINVGAVADTSKPGWFYYEDGFDDDYDRDYSGWYYKTADGVMLKDCSAVIDGVECIFDYNGRYVPGAVMSPLTSSYHLTDKFYNRLDQDISVITLHHMASVSTGEDCAEYFCKTGRLASSNYCIGVEGDISCNVSEEHGSWTSSTHVNDEKAICIEISDSNWEFTEMSDSTIESLINLSVDLINRYPTLGGSFNYKEDGTGNITLHKMFAVTSCPGEYLISKLPKIQEEVNKRLANR